MRATMVMVLALGMTACEGTREAPWLTAPSYASHATYFPLAGTVHAGMDCSSCHHATDSSFKMFDCVTCHNTQALTPDAIHLGVVAGYVSPVSPADSAECLQCHPTGTATMADHGRFFPIGAGTMHDFACSQCHTNSAARSDLSAQQCNVCHVANDPLLASAHSQSAIGKDYTASTACGGAPATSCPQSCLGCHADGNLTTVAGHPTMKVPHQGATCLRCHDGPLRTDLVASPVAPSTTPQQYAIDFANDPRTCTKLAVQQGCYECHPTCPPQGF